MSKKVERVLVQGTVNFKVNCNNLTGMVTPEIANNPRKLEAWLKDKAIKMIDIAEVEVEPDYEYPVNISESTANEFTDQMVNDADWKKIINEHKA